MASIVIILMYAPIISFGDVCFVSRIALHRFDFVFDLKFPNPQNSEECAQAVDVQNSRAPTKVLK